MPHSIPKGLTRDHVLKALTDLDAEKMSEQPVDRNLLIIVPCGQKKIWDKTPDAGPTPAKDAYTGSPFKVNRQFAEHFGGTWMILSAKYGFIEPEFTIPQPYNVTFKRKATNPVAIDELREQVRVQELDKFKDVIGLGGKEYRQAIRAAFHGTSVKLHFPFAGLAIGKAMQAIKQAIAANDPYLVPSVSKNTTVQATSAQGNVAEICQTLHQWFNSLPVHQFPFCENDIPLNGIYILFEEGETAHGTCRIVRIGTHTGNNQLRSRLKQHFLNKSEDRSIFRKNVGRCLLNRDGDPFLPMWELDLTTSVAKKMYAGKIDLKRQLEIEDMISAYLQAHLRFVVFEVPDKEQRLEFESRIISTVSLCPQCGPSKEWLGLHSPKQKICKCGLWQVNELFKQPFSVDELQACGVYFGAAK